MIWEYYYVQKYRSYEKFNKKCDENQNKINLFGFLFYNFSFYWFTNLNIHVLEYLLTSRTFIKIEKKLNFSKTFPKSNLNSPTHTNHSSTESIHNRFPRRARRSENKTFRHSSHRFNPRDRKRQVYFPVAIHKQDGTGTRAIWIMLCAHAGH